MNRFPLTPSDAVVIVGYLLLVMYIGLYFRKRMSSAEDYFAGGHQVPWWLAGVSHYISSASALTFVAYSQLGYTLGFVAIAASWCAMPGGILAGLIFARRWRQARVTTPVEFLENRFSSFVRQLMAWAGIPMKIAEDGLKLFATSLFLSVGLGISVAWALLACGVITLAYTYFGGLWALTVTDYVQFLMKALALLLLVPLAIWRAGGLRIATTHLPRSFFHVTGGTYTWTYMIGFSVMLAITLNGSWSLAQKFYSVGDTKQAEKAAWLSAILHFVGTPLMIMPAILGRLFLPDLIAQRHTADVYVYLILKLLPAGMVGIVVAALLSATMATVSSDFSSIAGVLTKDVYQRLINPAASQKKLLVVGRLITLLIGSMSIAIGLYLSLGGDQPVLHLMVVIASAFIAPSFLPLMGALVSRKLTTQGVITGFFLGLASGLTLLALRTWAMPHGFWPWMSYNFDGASILVNTGFTVLGMWLGTVLFRKTGDESEKFNQMFTNREEIRFPAHALAQALDLQRIVSFSTIGVGVLLAIAGLIAPAKSARVMDLTIAACFVALGVGRMRRRKSAYVEIARTDVKVAITPTCER
jgi:SSS family transporter